MDRTRFYNEVVSEGIPQLDFLDNGLSNFTQKYPASQYVVQEADLMRPDLISFKSYKTVRYWWIVCFVNGISDPFSDLQVGGLLVLPNVLDILDFYKKFRVR